MTGDTDLLAGTPARRLLVGERPVTAVTSVTLDGVAITDHRWRRSGALCRDTGWGGTDSEVIVAYSHGYATVPDDLWAVCRSAAARLRTNPDGKVRFDAAGEYSETLVGLFGFTLVEQQVLNRYRRRLLP